MQVQPSTLVLFEQELRAQVEAAQLALADAIDAGDHWLADAAREQLADLRRLAERNDVALPAPAEPAE